MESDALCQCCEKHPATRKCFSCDPSGANVIYMCSACDSRAHFGPMRYSHKIKSLANITLMEKVNDAYNTWADRQKQAIAECVQEIKNWTNDLDAQKQVDLEVMSAAFDPLKNAVVNRKRELAAQISAYYEEKKISLTEAATKCQNKINSVDMMTPLDPSAFIDLIPSMAGGHRATFPTSMQLEQVIRDIQGCELQPTATEADTNLVNSLTLLSGDNGQVVVPGPMESDGTFWVKRLVPPESYAYLCQLGYQCRRNVIVGESKRYSEHPQDLHSGLLVMVNVPGEEVWRRAVVIDPCVKDKPDKSGGCMASVVNVDSGYKQNVYQTRLTVCPDEFRAIPFLAVPCSLYPAEHEPLGIEPRWHFNDLVKEEKNRPKVFNAKFIHKKDASHAQTPVWYIELSDPNNLSTSINAKVEQKRAEKSVAKGAIAVEDIRVAAGLVPPSKVVMCSTKDASEGQVEEDSPTSTDLSDTQGTVQAEMSTSHADAIGQQAISPSNESQSTQLSAITDQSERSEIGEPVEVEGDNPLTDKTSGQTVDVVTHSELENSPMQSTHGDEANSSDVSSQRCSDGGHTPLSCEQTTSKSSIGGDEGRTSSNTSVNGEGGTNTRSKNSHCDGKGIIRNWINTPGRDQNRLPPLSSVLAAEFVPAAIRATSPAGTDRNPSDTGATSTRNTMCAGDDSCPTRDMGAEKEIDASQLHVGRVKAVGEETSTARQSSARSMSDQGCYQCGDSSHIARNCTLRTCSVCEGLHPTFFCEEARAAYERGGCPYCLSSKHSMKDSAFHCKPAQHYSFHFIERKSKRHPKGRRIRSGNRRY